MAYYLVAYAIPSWLHSLAIASLCVSAVAAIVILSDIAKGARQHMWIMNVVWPVTALWAGPLALWAYFKIGRLSTHRAMMHAKETGEDPPGKRKPFGWSVALAATHCGSGCTLGDIIAEWFVFFFPLSILGHKVFATWLLDFALAFLLGIAFQYFTIKPMKHLTPGEGLVAALKADTFSLTAWQVGMYGWMALVVFVLFGEISKTNPVFWFMMQIAMCAGFLVALPANWWLVRRQIKERM